MTTRLSGTRLVGLTGNLASGKSTVLACLARCGAQTLSADALVRELYTQPLVRKRLESWFGSAEPEQVARAVFRSAADRQKLERFLHPKVWRLIQKRLAACPVGWAVVEVPLLFETGWDKRMDLTVVVAGSSATLPARLQARGLTPQTYRRRLKAQGPEAEKIRRADVVILNEGSTRALQAKARRLYKALTTFYA